MQLLDWLAVEFRERGWSQKQMHRLLVTSATYRQASKVTADHLAKDPENRLFARASRFRMPSMVLRDVALSASGLLDRRLGGQPVYPYQPDQIWEALAITKERDFTYPASHGSRPLSPQPLHLLAADGEPGQHVRHGQSADLQRAGQPHLHAAARPHDAERPDLGGGVARARREGHEGLSRHSIGDWRLPSAACSAARPTDYDMTTLRRMHGRQLAAYRADAEAAKQLVGVGESPRDESLDLAEHAALSERLPGIFNLDEALTRE
jgi:hypothetical protein